MRVFHSKSESGQAMMEFALVAIFLTLLFAGAFTIGESLVLELQVSNVTRSAGVLMVRSVTDPNAQLNLADTQNQRILIREASGLGMASDAQNDPSSTGNGAIFLSKIILVGNNECAAGITPAPNGAPPWNTSNCPNFGSYVFGYYVAIGNTTRWASVFGHPPSSIVQSDGSISAQNIASNTGNQVSNMGSGGVITLNSSSYALMSEMFADISRVSVFSWYKPPVVYYRTIS